MAHYWCAYRDKRVCIAHHICLPMHTTCVSCTPLLQWFTPMRNHSLCSLDYGLAEDNVIANQLCIIGEVGGSGMCWRDNLYSVVADLILVHAC